MRLTSPEPYHTAWYSLVPMSSPRVVASLTPIALFVFVAFTSGASAQAPPPAPPTPAPAPPSTQGAGRMLTLEECIAIALEAQPRIQATLADYAAARYRVNQAMAPLLPQLSGLVSTTTGETWSAGSSAGGRTISAVNQQTARHSFSVSNKQFSD